MPRCTHNVQDDPLRNTKRLAITGHKSLYENGWFKVPGSSIAFIPPFAESEVFLFGRRFGFAKESFQKSLKKAAESVIILKEGNNLSMKVAGNISGEANAISQILHENVGKPGILIMSKSTANGLGIIGNSWKTGLESYEAVVQASAQMRTRMDALAAEMSETGEAGEQRPDFQQRWKDYKDVFELGAYAFVLGYANLYDNLKAEVDQRSTSLKDITVLEDQKAIWKFRKDMSEGTESGLKDVILGYGKDSGREFSKIKDDFAEVSSGAGLSFAILKVIPHVLKGIFFDGIIKPIGALAIYSVGFVTVNGVIYPVAAVGSLGFTTARVVTEVVYSGVKGVVLMVAPSVELAAASLIGSTYFVMRESYEGAGKGADFSALMARKSAAGATYGTGFVAEKGGKYVLAPLAATAVTLKEGIVGSGVLIGGATTGAVVTATGETGRLLTYTAGNTLAATTYAVGAATSFTVALGHGVYQLGKALGVPMGVAVGTGVVMSYEMMAQIGAHSLLAAADFSYLVLSLEGERWVVYAVKDVSRKADMLFSGAVVDLEEARKRGDEIARLPVSDEEIRNILQGNEMLLPTKDKEAVVDLKLDLEQKDPAIPQNLAATPGYGCLAGNCLTGEGTYLYTTGDRYQGSFQNGKRHGQGSIDYSNGDRFTGTFENDNKHGQGEFIYRNGEAFKGSYKLGMREGKGTYIFRDGRSFSGEFRNDGEAGEGKLKDRGKEIPCQLKQKQLSCQS